MQQIINDGETGDQVRIKLNDMFEELYDSDIKFQFRTISGGWVDEYVDGHVYFRFSTDQGATYSDQMLLLKGSLTNPQNGETLVYSSGSWINGEGTGGDFDNLTLNNGANRFITIEGADPGNTGDDLEIKAGANDDGIGGGDLTIRGGGELDEYGDVIIGADDVGSKIYLKDTTDFNGLAATNLGDGVNDSDAATMGQLNAIAADAVKTVYSISLPSATTVQGRVDLAAEGTDYPTGWVLSAGTNAIDLNIEHGLGRRLANINVCTASGDVEQLLRPFAGAYSGYSTLDENTLLINSLATTPSAIKIYIIFE